MIASFLALTLGAAQAAPAACPATYRGSALKSFEIFDGPVADNAILAPEVSRNQGGTLVQDWPVEDVYRQGRSLNLRCTYAPKVTQLVPVTRRVRMCRAQFAGKTVSLSCR